MTDLQRWLAERRPAPPEQLATAVQQALAREDVESGTGLETLVSAARTCLEEALTCPGRVRASAFSLLLADGLLTYACEAALDQADPDAVLLAMAEVAGGP